MTLVRMCVLCNARYTKPVWTSKANWKLSKYCSRKCLNKSKIGNTYRRGKKHPNIWNKGIPAPKGELNQSWKGDRAGYSAKHKWIDSILGRPTTCEHCGKTGLVKQQIHWSNKDHLYKRNIEDWQRLCAKCHSDYDKLNGLK